MSSTLPTPLDCCTTCTDPVSVDIPGAAGANGADGADGADGLNAFSLINGGAFLVPAFDASVDLTFEAPPGSEWMGLGQTVYIENFGYYRVDALPSTTTATLFNLGYTGNIDGDGILLFTDQGKVSPGGVQGPDGDVETGALLIVNNLADVADAEESRDNLGLGTAATFDQGNGNGEIPVVHDASGLTNGQAVFATTLGLESLTPSAARTALGLGSMSTQDSNAVNITGGTITGISLGTAGIPRDYLLFQHRELTTIDGGTFTQATWANIIPLNTEVYDTGGNGSVSAGVVTLAAGTYRARWRVLGHMVDSFSSRLYNISTTTIIAYSQNGRSAQSDDTVTECSGEARFTVLGGATLRLEARCETSRGGDGLGVANDFGASEIYSSLELTKEML